MNDTTEAVAELLNDRPEFREPLSRLLELDEAGPWSFEEAPLDSGQFGEIVSRGIVVRDGNEYKLADPRAVRRVIDGSDLSQSNDESASVHRNISRVIGRVDTGSLLALVIAVVGVVVARVAVPLGSVYRGGVVVYTGNDPYKYRYLVNRLLSSGELTLQSQPVATGDALYIATLHTVADAAGSTADSVLAVVPVALAVLTALVVYQICVVLTSDKRVGVAAVALLAVTPVHAFRSSLGFVDHHAFDFLWVAVTLLGIVTSSQHDDGSNRLAGAALVGLGTAAQVLAWRGGPLLTVPIPIILLGVTVFAVRSGARPLTRVGHLLGGVAVGAVSTVAIHSVLGWGQLFRVVTPTVTLAGGLVLLVVGEIGSRLDVSPWSVTGVTTLMIGGAVIVGFETVDVLRGTVTRGVGYFGRTNQSGIAETFSLFSGGLGSVLSPVLFFGFVFPLAVPVLGWALLAGYRRGDDRWFAVGVYGVYLLVASSIQVRFAGALAVLTAVLGAVGFLRLLSWLSVVDTPQWIQDPPSSVISVEVPSRETVRTVALVFLLVSAVGVVQTGVKQQQIATDDETFAAVSATAAHASQTGAGEYPDSYVFSPWGDNYEFNYFTSRWAGSYDFAQDHYTEFLTARTPSAINRERDRLRRHGTGYVAVRQLGEGLSDDTVYSRLYERLGSGTDTAPGLGQFRAVHVPGDGEWRVFEFVDGTRMVGQTDPGSRVTITTNATVDGRKVQYRRTVTANAYGEYGVTVPYPGRYTVSGEEGSVAVTDDDVDTGRYTSPYRLHLTMDDVNDGRVSDTISGATAKTTAARGVDGVIGGAVALDGTDSFEFDTELARETESLSLAFWVRGNFSKTGEAFPRVFSSPGSPQFGVWARTGTGDFGTAVVTDDERARNFGIKQARFDSWTHVAVVLDGDEDVLRLYRNGSLVSETDASTVGTLTVDRFAVGGKYNFRGEYAPVALDDVRLYARPLGNETITTLSNQTTVGPLRKSTVATVGSSESDPRHDSTR